MTRVLTFEFENDTYVIKENSVICFSINAKELIFNSLDFYNGIYKGGKSTQINFKKDIVGDSLNKGEYIYNWLNEIIGDIAKGFNEEEISDDKEKIVEIVVHSSRTRLIPKYELKSCGGDGFFMENAYIPYENIHVETLDADFAVTISGHSMEPTLPNGSVLLIKRIQELNDGDIGLFLIDGESMCKRYNKCDDTIILTPDNDSGEYDSIPVDSNMTCIIQGKVLGIHEPTTV